MTMAPLPAPVSGRHRLDSFRLEPAISALNDGPVCRRMGGVGRCIRERARPIFNPDGSRWGDDSKSILQAASISRMSTSQAFRMAGSLSAGPMARESENGDGSGAGIKTQIFDPRMEGIVFVVPKMVIALSELTLMTTCKALEGSNSLSGRGGSDTLEGGSARDVLDGGAGSDVMTGGEGGDIYTVDRLSDRLSRALRLAKTPYGSRPTQIPQKIWPSSRRILRSSTIADFTAVSDFYRAHLEFCRHGV